MGTAGSVGPRGLGETWPAAGGGTRPKGHRRPSAARVSLPCILSSLGAPALRAKAVSRLALHALRAIDAPGRAGCAGIADGAAGGSRSSGDGSVRWSGSQATAAGKHRCWRRLPHAARRRQFGMAAQHSVQPQAVSNHSCLQQGNRHPLHLPASFPCPPALPHQFGMVTRQEAQPPNLK